MRLPMYCDYIGEEDDVGDISYDSFHQNMDLFRHNRFLNVGESNSNNICLQYRLPPTRLIYCRPQAKTITFSLLSIDRYHIHYMYSGRPKNILFFLSV
jgi:hypothetical protein